jgi:hypothetical protein
MPATAARSVPTTGHQRPTAYPRPTNEADLPLAMLIIIDSADRVRSFLGPMIVVPAPLSRSERYVKECAGFTVTRCIGVATIFGPCPLRESYGSAAGAGLPPGPCHGQGRCKTRGAHRS